MEPKMELLAPAGSPEILRAVIDAGADAVYLGGDRFGARAYANNFSEEELLSALDYVHLRGKKIYLTVNTLFKNNELSELRDYLLPFYKNGLDAVLVQDFGALVKIHEWFPDMPIHTSTQMTVTGASGVKFLQQYGVTRVVMAREVSLEEMRKIHEETGMELEAFVHGALCYSYSGQCLFSSLLGGRSGNRGRCAQPCRLPYTVIDADGRIQKEESYILSLKDFCSIEGIDKMQEAGVYSLKIEGRMKQLSYAAGVVSMYRKYVDLVLSGEEYLVDKNDLLMLEEYGNRCGFTDAYLYKHNGSEMITYEKPSFCQTREYEKTDKFYHKINGSLTIKKNEPIQLFVRHENHSVTVCAGMPDMAQKAPITAEDVKKRLQKTKDTAFLFEELSVQLDEGLFVPNGVLNQLKRDALEQLQEQILSDYRRDGEREDSKKEDSSEIGDKKDAHVVSLENRNLLETVLPSDIISDIYLDSTAYDRAHLIKYLSEDVSLCHASGKRAFFIMPPVCRAATMGFYEGIAKELRSCGLDGFVVKNLEGFWFVKENFPSAELICDHNLYSYNNCAADAYLAAGADGVTVPLELNRKEIAARRNTDSEIWVYGYYPLMTTAQCVCKNAAGCKHTPGIRFLRDRLNKAFPVRNCCEECVNIIYNSLPTMLFSGLDELRRYNLHRFRLHFSVETQKEVREILHMYEDAVLLHKSSIPESKKERYTNGHYKRGVE